MAKKCYKKNTGQLNNKLESVKDIFIHKRLKVVKRMDLD